MKVTTVLVPHERAIEENFKDPSRFYIIDALGNSVYLKCRSQRAAQEYVDTEYGKGKYTVRVVVKAQVR